MSLCRYLENVSAGGELTLERVPFKFAAGGMVAVQLPRRTEVLNCIHSPPNRRLDQSPIVLPNMYFYSQPRLSPDSDAGCNT